MNQMNRIEVDEFWADSTIIEAGDYVFVGYCMANYPARKAYTSDFIREGIRFQVDAIAYKG
ncbi:MAG: hypothetical protein K2O59_13335 [Lachnospiraceae bacterium]|nr:hypothetical protein [Lachnospiraceae bacterium]